MGVAVVNSVKVILYDANGVAMAVEDGVAVPANTRALLIAGSDGTNARIAKVTAAGRVVTDGSEVTQPISAAALPLPSGAATSANQTTANSSLSSILAQLDVALSTRASQTTSAAIETILTAIRDTAGVKKITDALPAGTNHLGGVDAEKINGATDSGNSSTALLGSSAAFTGTAFDTLHYPTAVVIVKSDQASATDGLSFQWSPDGTNWDVTSNSSVVANVGRGFHINHRGRYFRVVYTNGSIAQGSFRLGVIHRPAAMGLITRPLGDTIDDSNFANIARAIITAKTPGGSYVPATVDDDGRLVVAAASASATTSGFSFGVITTSATTDVPVRKTTYTEPSSNAQRSVGSSSANDASAGTGARKVKITYFDSSGAGPYTETVTLNGTTPVNTTNTNICFIEHLEVTEVGSGGSNAGTISLFGSTGGGSGTVGTIAIGDNQTLWGHHYVPTGQDCFLTSFTGNNDNGVATTLFSIRAKNLAVATSPDILVSDMLVEGAALAQTQRTYGTPIKVVGPARVTLYAAPSAAAPVTSRASVDFYEQ